MRTILVTGGAGFIGSHLSDFLIAKGNRVICVDNLLTGSRRNISHLMRHPRFTFIKHDIIEPLYLRGRISEIYNLACPASPIQYQKNPIRTVKANTVGVLNMLGLAKRHRAKILQASTSEVYGDPLEHPQKESYHGNVNPTSTRACYDEGKRVAETLCFDYHRQHGVAIRVARIFNTYGPRMAFDDGRVISNFIVQALRNRPLTIYGNGAQTRSFCYVADMVAGLAALMRSEATGPVNLGNPTEQTIREIAERIIRLTNSKSKLARRPLPPDDPQKRRPDIGLARRTLKWQPRIRFDAGLRQTIADFQERLAR